MIEDLVFVAALGSLTIHLLLICFGSMAVISVALIGMKAVAALGGGGRFAPEESNRAAPRRS